MKDFIKHVPARRSLFRVVLVFGMITAFLTTSALAQPRKDAHTITIFKNDKGLCVYEILDQGNQDLFRVTAGGFVTFVAVDTQVRIEIQVDAETDTTSSKYGKRGVGPRDASGFILDSGKRRTVRARYPKAPRERGFTTRHKVWITCLEGGRENPSLDKIRASRRGGGSENAESQGMNLSAVDVRGPQMPAVRVLDMTKLPDPLRRRATGGPEMEVEDP